MDGPSGRICTLATFRPPWFTEIPCNSITLHIQMQTFAYILSYCFVLAQKMFIITQFDFVQTTMCCFKTSSNNDFSDFFQDLLQGRFRWPTLTLWVWRGIQRGRGKRHSRREIFHFFFQFFEILKSYIFLVIPRSWGVHRYPWFQNRSINMVRVEADDQTDRQTYYAVYNIDFEI